MVNYDILRSLLKIKEIKTLLVILLGIVLNEIFNYLLSRFFRNKFIGKLKEDKKSKIPMVISLFKTITTILLWFIILMVIFSFYNIRITSILTGFGIIGIIIGLSAQVFITDILSGIIIILDKLFMIGDEVKIGDIEGRVLNITLRRTYIKDKNGYLHSIPNSQIKVVSKKVE